MCYLFGRKQHHIHYTTALCSDVHWWRNSLLYSMGPYSGWWTYIGNLCMCLLCDELANTAPIAEVVCKCGCGVSMQQFRDGMGLG